MWKLSLFNKETRVGVTLKVNGWNNDSHNVDYFIL